MRRKSTEIVELVETQNIALSLHRLRNLPNQWQEAASRRALYHAICMTNSFQDDQRRLIREALKLP